MAQGPGKYDAECTLVRLSTGAQVVVVAVIGGERGSGFSVQGDESTIRNLPAMLRMLADEIEKS